MSSVGAADRAHGPRRPLRVLLVTPRYFPMVGGVENHVYQVARRFAGAGVHATILTTDTTGRLPAYELSEGIQIVRVRAWPAHRDYYLAPDIYPVVTRAGWDIVHIQSYHTLVAPLGMLAAIRANLPFVVTFHGGGHSSQLRNSARGIQRALLRPLLRRADRLVAIARFEIDLYGRELGLPPERFVLIPNGADIPRVDPPPARSPDSSLIASVGRLERYKGHHRLIAALPHILAQRPDARLWIAGEGPYRPELERMAQELGVADRVDIRAIPPVERERMAQELSRAALVVLLSEYETHPLAILEAASLGLPALVADSSGLSELAERGVARAIPLQSSAEQVAAAVLEQLRNPLLPAKIDLPTWDDCAADLLALYQTVTRRSR